MVLRGTLRDIITKMDIDARVYLTIYGRHPCLSMEACHHAKWFSTLSTRCCRYVAVIFLSSNRRSRYRRKKESTWSLSSWATNLTSSLEQRIKWVEILSRFVLEGNNIFVINRCAVTLSCRCQLGQQTLARHFLYHEMEYLHDQDKELVGCMIPCRSPCLLAIWHHNDMLRRI
jgi:hypothetical protein